jgi:hypothetical protein
LGALGGRRRSENVAALFLYQRSFSDTRRAHSFNKSEEKEVDTKRHASGTFEVKMTAQPAAENAAIIGRFSLDKVFFGDLEGTSLGEMLAIGTEVAGSAGYVAMERVSAKLNGRDGSFALQHSGTMNRGLAELSVTVVPDSGTGALIGLSGRMEIKITDGTHFYEFDYTLPDAS